MTTTQPEPITKMQLFNIRPKKIFHVLLLAYIELLLASGTVRVTTGNGGDDDDDKKIIIDQIMNDDTADMRTWYYR